MRKNFILLFLFFSLSACELAKLGEPIVVPDVADEFYVDWIENLSESGRSLELLIRTIEEEQCPDATISFDLNRYSRGYYISLKDIVASTDCEVKSEPAIADISLGSVSDGNHKIQIDLKNSVKNEGSLQVASDYYSLDMGPEDGILILNNVLYKVPENAVWGYVRYRDTEDEAIAASFIDELAKKSEEENFSAGYYGHFRIGLSGQIAILDQPISSRIKTFLFSIPSERATLSQLVESFRDEYGERIEIILFDGKGWKY